MEKSSFAMAKFGLEPKESIPKRDCGFYLKYIFLFTSLIQFLIILGLVLFMVYGNVQAGTDTHLRLLEEQVHSHYRRALALGATNANLSRALNATLKDRDKAQGMALKAQKELEKCNSSQTTSSVPQLQELVYLQLMLVDCRMTTNVINSSCSADKLQLRSQLDQVTAAQKKLEASGEQSRSELAKAAREAERCQQELRGARSEAELSRAELELQRRECRAVRAELGQRLPALGAMAQQLPCGEAAEELRRLRGSTESLFRRHQERDSQYVLREQCELSVQQCELNCSRERQELQGSVGSLREQGRAWAERSRALQEQSDREKKELEERRRAAETQAETLREQLGVCLGAKVPHLELSGSRVPLGSGRSSSFPVPGSYLEFLKNPAALGTMGKKNLEDLQRMLQVMEQQAATLKNPSG